MHNGYKYMNEKYFLKQNKKKSNKVTKCQIQELGYTSILSKLF